MDTMDTYGNYMEAKYNLSKLNHTTRILFELMGTLIERDIELDDLALLMKRTTDMVKVELDRLITAGVVIANPDNTYRLRSMMKYYARELLYMESPQLQATIRKRVADLYASKYPVDETQDDIELSLYL